MGTYVFLTTSIARVGGAQLYLARKSNYLAENGWNVIIVHYLPGNVIIEFNANIKTILINELKYSPQIYSLRRIQKSLELIFPTIKTKKLVIESHLLHLAKWGEIMAKSYSGINITYLLNEQIKLTESWDYSFLKFKLDQGLLFGITPVSLKTIFRNLPGDAPYLKAIGCSSNNVEDIPNRVMDHFSKSDWTILSIGRLEKNYIIPTFQEIVNFALKYKEKEIDVIVVGGAYKKENHDNAIELLSNAPNIKVYDIGYVWPIPFSCFVKADVAIASSGSVLLSESVGLPTIVIDANDYKPIGVYKQTTNNFIFREKNEKPINLVVVLEETLLNKRFTKQIKPLNVETLNYDKHIEVTNTLVRDYYNVSEAKLSKKQKVLKLVMKLVGFDFTDLLTKYGLILINKLGIS